MTPPPTSYRRTYSIMSARKIPGEFQTFPIHVRQNDFYIINLVENNIPLTYYYGNENVKFCVENRIDLIKGINCGIFCFRNIMNIFREPGMHIEQIHNGFYINELEYKGFEKQVFVINKLGKVNSLKDSCIASIINCCKGRPTNNEMGIHMSKVGLPASLIRDICGTDCLPFNRVIDKYLNFMWPCVRCWKTYRYTKKLASHRRNATPPPKTA